MTNLMKSAVFGATALSLCACATTATGPTTYDFDESRASVNVLVMPVDVEVKLAKVGSTDLRADWTEEAVNNFENSITSHLEGTGEKVVAFTDIRTQSEDVQQLMLLQQHVAEAITSHVTAVDIGSFRGLLPHKKGENQLTYSLGEGVKALRSQSNADYAAFLTNRTVIESSGSFWTKVAIGAVTGYTPALSSFRGTYATLVDLNTGDVVWLKANSGGTLFGSDPRSGQVTDAIIDNLLSEGPFTDGQESKS